MDCLTPEQRHKNMVNIKSKDTSIEVVLRKALWKKGIRYRKNYKLLPGTPDIAITKYKIAIFCDSEFFHGKDWEVLKPRLEKGKNAAGATAPQRAAPLAARAATARQYSSRLFHTSANPRRGPPLPGKSENVPLTGVLSRVVPRRLPSSRRMA